MTARLNYIASDRPDLQYAVKECARHMARPQVGSWCLLKKVARFTKPCWFGASDVNSVHGVSVRMNAEIANCFCAFSLV